MKQFMCDKNNQTWKNYDMEERRITHKNDVIDIAKL